MNNNFKHHLFDADFFIEGQLAQWPLAQANYKALSRVEQRQIDVGTYSIKVQYNPARIRSTNANVSQNAIAERPCFLCQCNRPIEQIALPFGAASGNVYQVLVNPYPIFSQHLTIVAESHEAQHLTGRVADMAELSRLMPQMAIFFNGAQCGASAPDHMHFQASTLEAWHIIADFDNAKSIVLKQTTNGSTCIAPHLGRLIYKIETESLQYVESELKLIMEHHGIADDMINVVMYANEANICALVVPRKAFRPWQYAAQANEQLLISPASAEVCGLFITPSKEHFDKLTAADVASIFEQVCFSPSEHIKY